MIYIILSLILYSVAVMIMSFATRHANSNLVITIINTIAAIIPATLVLATFNKKILENSSSGIIAALIGGVVIALYTLALGKSFQMNKVALVTPVIFGGTIFLTAILSYFIFKEKLPPIHIAGLVSVVAGLGLIIYSAATGK